MITDLFIEQFYWLVLSLLRLDFSSDFDLDCVRSFSRSVHRCNYFRFLLGLIFVWFDHSLVRLSLFSRFRSLSRKLMRSFGRWQVISLFTVCVFNFLFFFFPFPCNTGSTRESSGPSAGKSYHTCAIEHQIQQILRHLETTGIQNTSHCICQLETKMCT